MSSKSKLAVVNMARFFALRMPKLMKFSQWKQSNKKNLRTFPNFKNSQRTKWPRWRNFATLMSSRSWRCSALKTMYTLSMNFAMEAHLKISSSRRSFSKKKKPSWFSHKSSTLSARYSTTTSFTGIWNPPIFCYTMASSK